MKNILLVILSLSTLILLYLFLLLRSKIGLISKEVAKIVINKQKPVEGITDSESFIKFLSESRDWAFGYIEQVQDGLKTFDQTVGPKIKYFDEYGDAMGMKPNYEMLQEISIAYKELKKLMPSDIND